MKSFDEADDPRRRILIQALAAGAFATNLPEASAQGFNIFGSKPAKLPPTQSIYRIAGQATVNDKPATLDTPVVPGDTVETGKGSEIIFVVNSNSMILRGGSKLTIETEKKSAAGSLIISGLRLLTGALLSVSRNTPMRVRTPNATVGIRGTGFYMEAEPDQTYFCTCYGITEVSANADPENKETIMAKQHDRPVYILSNEAKGKNIRNAPFINHTDQELALVETLVGREPAFVFAKEAYTSPRRTY
ncbi:MAG: FecR family protein [Usitatibacteraceae bacterium]